MTYKQDVIAARIKAARRENGLSLSKVAEYCGVKQYQTVSKWETGNAAPSVGNLMKLCELFNCELGYLLGEPGYENKTREKTDISQATGLTETAVNELLEAKRCNQWFSLKALNELLTYDVLRVLEVIGRYLTTTEPPEKRPDGYERPAESGYVTDMEQALAILRMRVQKELKDEAEADKRREVAADEGIVNWLRSLEEKHIEGSY